MESELEPVNLIDIEELEERITADGGETVLPLFSGMSE